MANCRYCAKEITWLKEEGKFTPIETDGQIHKCEKLKAAKQSFRNISLNELEPDEIKKYEESINSKKRK